MTGDKIETAINIGYAAGLLDDCMLINIIDLVTEAALKQTFTELENQYLLNNNKSKAIVISGDCLTVV